MNKVWCSILLMLCTAASFAQKNKQIVWSKQKLNWKDFQAKPEPRFAAASTAYDILMDLKKSASAIKITVKAIFFKHKSWKKKDWINDQVLDHEQLHFEIVELFARKFRKEISALKPNSFKELKELTKKMYTENDRNMDRFQDQYDDETDGSMNGAKQREWQAKINKELTLYEDHSSIELTTPLKSLDF